MITSIQLKNCTPYQSAEISDCKRINYVFGANGSGKSTISSLLSGSQDERFESCSINWSGSDHEPIYVYNRDFRKTNFRQTIPGVFTMGSATIDEINALETMKEALEKKKEKWEEWNNAYKRQTEDAIPSRETQFKNDAWEQILKQNEQSFQKAFEGFRSSKERFINELKRRIDGSSNHEGKVCTIEELSNRASTLYDSKPERCNRFTLDIGEWLDTTDEIRKDVIWDTVIVGNEDVDIAALINVLGNSSWVDQGRKYIRPNSKVCPFCQQETITEAFKTKIESFFDTEYKERISYMNDLRQKYQDSAEKIVLSIKETIQDEKACQIGKIDKEIYNAKQELLKSLFSEHVQKIDEKIKEPGIKIEIPSVESIVQDIENLLNEANKKIDSHNILVDERDTEEEKLTDDVWATLISNNESLIKAYKRDISGLNRGVSNIKTQRDEIKVEIDQLEEEIVEKGKNITSVQPTINEINKALRAYGFTNFSIQPSDSQENYYCIKREDGTLASDSLSEGEETFLTFLYFMQWTKGAIDPNHISEKKIIVLDDPISSLDSTILYIVGAMVKDLSEKIRNGNGDVSQMFILTHNVYFHKEASFIDGRTKELSDTNYWIVRKNDGVSNITSYGMKNPITTSYELLWNELRDDSDVSIITIQNTMRRIIENYFGIIGNKRTDYLIDQFDNAEEKMIARSLLYWINDGSHCIPDDLYIDHYTDAVPRYKSVFRELFAKSDHLAHYNMMMQIEDDEKDEL